MERFTRFAVLGALWGAVAFPCAGEVHLIDDLDPNADGRRLLIYVAAEQASGNNLGSRFLLFHCSAGNLELAINPGVLFHEDDSVPVHIRFDDAPEMIRDFGWNNTALHLEADMYLDAAIAAGEMTVKVGEADSMHFDLATARPDLIEFGSRCVAWRWRELDRVTE